MNDKDWLRDALAARDAYIEDDGFTDQVMHRLPRARIHRRGHHDWIVLVAAATASAVVALQFPLAPFVQVLSTSLQLPVVMGSLMATAMVLGLGGDKLKELLPW